MQFADSLKKWPQVELLVQEGIFAYIDLVFAETLLAPFRQASEEMACALCYLLKNSRQGHLSLSIPQDPVFPPPYEAFSAFVAQGLETLPAPLLTLMGENTTDPFTPVCRQGNRYYLQRSWLEETLFLDHYARLLSTSPSIEMDLPLVNDKLQRYLQAGTLNTEQADAIRSACGGCFSMMTGGPGTGKTYTAGLLICVLCESLSEPQKESFKIALAAPTGKAAANLQKSLQAALQGYVLSHPLTASTLHQLLNLKQHAQAAENVHPLSADLILVDESSMIDAKLMGKLFSMVKPGARLILIGDSHQLPPVESGGLFADLVETSACTTALKKCIRTDSNELLQFAGAVNCGDMAEILRQLNAPGSAVRGVKKDKESLQKLIRYGVSRYAFLEQLSTDYAALLEQANQFRILTPLRQGEYGTEQINRLIFEQLLKKTAMGTPFAIPILVTKNDYRLNLFNGDMGILIRKIVSKDPSFPLREEDQVYFPGNRKIPALLLSQYEYAYCLSVHKSQGSEFEDVLLVLPEGSERFGRKMLYTGATRAKKRLEVWSSEEILTETVRVQTRRMSGVKERLLN